MYSPGWGGESPGAGLLLLLVLWGVGDGTEGLPPHSDVFLGVEGLRRAWLPLQPGHGPLPSSPLSVLTVSPAHLCLQYVTKGKLNTVSTAVCPPERSSSRTQNGEEAGGTGAGPERTVLQLYPNLWGLGRGPERQGGARLEGLGAGPLWISCTCMFFRSDDSSVCAPAGRPLPPSLSTIPPLSPRPVLIPSSSPPSHRKGK